MLRARSLAGAGTLTVMRNSSVSPEAVGEVVATKEAEILIAVEATAIVKLDTIERLLSIGCGLPKTTVVVV